MKPPLNTNGINIKMQQLNYHQSSGKRNTKVSKNCGTKLSIKQEFANGRRAKKISRIQK